MQNVSMVVKDGRLTIIVDLAERFGPSKSGKTIIVASTGGNVDVPDTPKVKMGLNVYEAR